MKLIRYRSGSNKSAIVVKITLTVITNQDLNISASDPGPHRSALKTAARIQIRMERFGSGSVIRTFKEVKFQKIVLIKLNDKILFIFYLCFWVPTLGSGSKWRKVGTRIQIRIRITVDADPNTDKNARYLF